MYTFKVGRAFDRTITIVEKQHGTANRGKLGEMPRKPSVPSTVPRDNGHNAMHFCVSPTAGRC